MIFIEQMQNGHLGERFLVLTHFFAAPITDHSSAVVKTKQADQVS